MFVHCSHLYERRLTITLVRVDESSEKYEQFNCTSASLCGQNKPLWSWSQQLTRKYSSILIPIVGERTCWHAYIRAVMPFFWRAFTSAPLITSSSKMSSYPATELSFSSNRKYAGPFLRKLSKFEMSFLFCYKFNHWVNELSELFRSGNRQNSDKQFVYPETEEDGGCYLSLPKSFFSQIQRQWQTTNDCQKQGRFQGRGRDGRWQKEQEQ